VVLAPRSYRGLVSRDALAQGRARPAHPGVPVAVAEQVSVVADRVVGSRLSRHCGAVTALTPGRRKMLAERDPWREPFAEWLEPVGVNRPRQAVFAIQWL
jgi:hypothetical protein